MHARDPTSCMPVILHSHVNHQSGAASDSRKMKLRIELKEDRIEELLNRYSEPFVPHISIV
jgi:hypothetical protein